MKVKGWAMSIQTYQKASLQGENPRSTEYRLLGQVTKALMDVADAGPVDIARKVEALDWNRRVWSTFATDCSSNDNQLPDQLRAAFISLSIWVSKHSSAVMREGADIQDLIDINTTIMQGLAAGESQAA